MSKFIANNWLKIIIVFSFLFISLAVSYYFLFFLPQKEQSRIELEKFRIEEDQQEKEANRSYLNDCISEAEESAHNAFVSICRGENKISGGNDAACEAGTTKDTLEYMNASNLKNIFFKGTLEKLEIDKNNCYKRYPQD